MNETKNIQENDVLFDAPVESEGKFDTEGKPQGGYPPEGTHIMKVERIEYEQSKEYKVKDEAGNRISYYGMQIQPTMEVVSGPHAGKRCRDFLPCPTPGKRLPKVLANRWVNFARACGFDFQEGNTVPTGMRSLGDLVGRTLSVVVLPIMKEEIKKDEMGNDVYNDDGNVVKEKVHRRSQNGELMFGPKWFGYSRAGEQAQNASPKSVVEDL
jgi:hypothetical protein